MCVFEDFRGCSGLGRNSDRQPQECITKAPKLNGMMVDPNGMGPWLLDLELPHTP